MTKNDSKPSTDARPPIAVVGLSTLFPGSVDSTGFWRDILEGNDQMSDVPASHWLIEDYYDADPKAPDKTYAKRGAFVPKVDFDPMAWGVPPSTIPATDTCQLLALIVAQRVLEDAARGQFDYADRDRMSVILGVTSAQELLGAMVSRLQRPVWTKALREMGLGEDEVQEACERIEEHYTPWQEATFPGVLGNVVAGRIANRLNLGGTNCVTDAACASSFSALSMAVSELYLGTSDVVICGGADTMNDIFMYLCFSKTPALSKSGDCRPFSDQADGTMLGEGFGMVALKRLDQAEKDGDRIYGVIRGVGSSSDGGGTAVYAPVPKGQAKAIRRAYQLAGYGPDTVELVEAHGTGTIAGDAAEFGGLRMVFDESGREDRQWCALGSVKSMIGHTKAAAGAAGLIKGILALQHKVLPPTIKIDQPNPKLELTESPFHLSTRARPWVRPEDHPRRAGVSSFGFGGSNFHIAVEEYVGEGTKAFRRRVSPTELFVLGAATPEALAKAATQLKADVAIEDGMFAFLARHTQETFDPKAECRLSVVAKDADELAKKLDKAAALVAKGEPAATPDGIAFGKGAFEGDLAFVYPGQGSQYVDMGADVAMTWEEALRAWDRAASLDVTRALHSVVFPMPVFDDASKKAQEKTLTATEWAQPALGVTSQSYGALMARLGLKPAAVTGHSFGEVMALHAAGALSDADAIRVARARGERMAAAASGTPGAMTAVSADAETLKAKLAEWAIEGVVFANHNHPTQVVLSGPTAGIDQVEAKLKDAKLRFTRLPVATAFHSSVVSDSVAPFAGFLEGVELKAPSVPVYGNTEAAPYPSDPAAMRALLANQLANPVRFVESIEAMYAAGVRTFVEVGAGSVLTGLVGRILKGRPHLAVSLDRKGKHGLTSLNTALGQLAAAGAPLQLGALWEAFEPVEDPRTTKKPKLSVAIGGANHGKPYPPLEGAVALPKPNPPRAAQVAAKPAPAATPAAPKTAAAPTAAAPTPPKAPAMTKPTAPSAPIPAPVAQPAAPVAPPMVAQPMVAQPMVAMPAPTGEWASAYLAIQSQAIQAHTAYTQAMAQAHGAFIQAQQHAMQVLPAMAGAQPVAQPQYVAPQPQYVAPQPQYVAPAPTATPTPTPTADVRPPTPTTESRPPTPTSDVRPATPTADVRPATPTADVRPPTPTSTAAPAVDLQKLMLQIVAEKTGYPTEMLELGMDLEGDLGVDSIKRVEILAAMREQAPNLPEVDPAELGKLRTLQEIVDKMSAAGAGAALKGEGQGEGEGEGTTPSASPAVDLQRLMLEVVAEKTGYPVDMLELGMDLEGDLGVDSIKRVEILAAMREQAPNLPEVDPAELGKLRTLQEIVDKMSAAGAGAPVASAPAAPAARATSGVDLQKLMLEVVAEKTGYPTDMLELSMDLEGDLGVDSIKRVEILAAMREQAPDLPEVDPAELGKLRTLQEIVDKMSAAGAGAALKGEGQGEGEGEGTTPSASPAVDLQRLMLEVVAEKTGYPVDMLELDMDLEGDLGVDSIKRVEILAAMREQAPDLPEVDPAELGKLRTLQEIVDKMSSAGAGAASKGEGQGEGEVASPAAPLTDLRWVLDLEVAPANGFALDHLFEATSIAIVDGGSGVAEALAERLRAHGVDAAAGDPTSASDGVIFLGGLREVASHDDALAVQREAFVAAKAVAAKLTEAPGVFVTVQDTGGDFAMSGAGTRAWLGGLPGLVKSAAQEWANVGFRAIDIERAGRDGGSIADTLAAELLRGGAPRLEGASGGGIEVALRADGTRFTLVSRPAESSGDSLRVDAESVILASGGARGVTATTLIALAEASKARFVLLGRTPLSDEPASCANAADDAAIKKALLMAAKASGQPISPKELGAQAKGILASREVRETLAAIEAAGGQAKYVSASVTDRAAMDAALADVRSEWGPITGIVHGAGLLADKFIADKTLEDFDRVLDVKAGGLAALLEATANDPLKVLVAFSSVAGRCGNRGQCDYAMANETLNKVVRAEAARRGDLFARSLGWGPWEGGMVTPALKAHFEAMGVPLIPLATGAKLLTGELADTSDSVELVLGGEPKPEALSSGGDSVRRGGSFDVIIDRAGFPAIDDHRVKGQPVLPVALVLELFARAVEATRPDLIFTECEDLKVLRGVALDDYEGAGDRLTVSTKQISNGDGVVFQLELLDAEGKRRYAARGIAKPNPATAPSVPAPPGGLSAFEGEVYDGVALFHGDAFKVIVGAPSIGEGGLDATLEGAGARGWPAGNWETDPALVDGGLQLALLWTCREGGAALPTSLARFRRFSPGLAKGSVRAILAGRESKGDRSVSDLVFVDESGTTVAALEGVEMHVLPGSR